MVIRVRRGGKGREQRFHRAIRGQDARFPREIRSQPLDREATSTAYNSSGSLFPSPPSLSSLTLLCSPLLLFCRFSSFSIAQTNCRTSRERTLLSSSSIFFRSPSVSEKRAGRARDGTEIDEGIKLSRTTEEKRKWRTRRDKRGREINPLSISPDQETAILRR